MNKLLFNIFLTITLISTPLFANVTTAKTTSLKNVIPVYTQDKANIVITKDQPEFMVKLKSNPTTGYAWFLREYNANLLTPTKHIFEAPEKQLMGESGFEFWKFKVKPSAFLVPHQTSIRLVYVKPWESDANGTQVIFYVRTKE